MFETANWDGLIVMALRMYGGTWEQWEEQLTMDRLEAMMKSLDEVPMLDMSVYAIARALGMKAPERRTAPAAANEQQARPLGLAEFVAAFGGQGEIRVR